MAPWVSILIVNYNTRDLLEKCLQSIFETKQGRSVEVLIWDNSSSDGSGEMIVNLFPQVKLMAFHQNVGYTRAMNALLAAAKGEYFLLLHPDVELLTGSLQAFLDFFSRHKGVGVLGGNLYYPDGTPNPCEILFPGFRNDLKCFLRRLWFRLPSITERPPESNPLEWCHTKTCQVNWVWNACMMVRREVFENIGYFDEDLFVWYADWDVCNRAAEAGWSTYYVREAIAIHHERQSFAKEGILKEKIVYKIDGWHSAPRQMRDRFTFLKKYSSPLSILGVKMVSIVENALRIWLILGNLLLRRVVFDEASFQLQACLHTIQSILKA